MKSPQDDDEEAFYNACLVYFRDYAPYPQTLIGGGIDPIVVDVKDRMFETRSSLVMNGAEFERVQELEWLAHHDADLARKAQR